MKNIIHNDIHANINTKIEISNKNAHQESMLRLGLRLLLIWLNMNTHKKSNVKVLNTTTRYNIPTTSNTSNTSNSTDLNTIINIHTKSYKSYSY